MNWDDSIIQEVAERRAIFVLGAGASMACETPDGKRPPSWLELLSLLNKSVSETSERNYADSLIESGRLLEAAEVIRMNISAQEFTRIIRETLRNPDYQPSAIHKAIIEIDPKIVITTNYDEIYEKLFRNSFSRNGYTVSKPSDQDTIISNLRSGDRCILKMHGCVTSTADIILNKTSYFNIRRKYPKYYNAIDALFLVNTIIFVGSSLDDPDLQLVLENAQIAAPSDYKHLAILEAREHESQRKILRENFNIEPIEYPVSAHGEVVAMLETLRDLVEEWRTNHD